jgi:hypothetical protein
MTFIDFPFSFPEKQRTSGSLSMPDRVRPGGAVLLNEDQHRALVVASEHVKPIHGSQDSHVALLSPAQVFFSISQQPAGGNRQKRGSAPFHRPTTHAKPPS